MDVLHGIQQWIGLEAMYKEFQVYIHCTDKQRRFRQKLNQVLGNTILLSQDSNAICQILWQQPFSAIRTLPTIGTEKEIVRHLDKGLFWINVSKYYLTKVKIMNLHVTYISHSCSRRKLWPTWRNHYKMAERGVSCNVHYKPLPFINGLPKIWFRMEDYPNAYRFLWKWSDSTHCMDYLPMKMWTIIQNYLEVIQEVLG